MRIALLLLFLLLPTAASGHRVTIFAWVEDGTVRSVSQFSRGSKAQGAAVEVHGHPGPLLLRGTTNAQGEFHFPVPETARNGATGLRLVVQAGQGHAGEWIVEPAELASASPTSQPDSPEATPQALQPAAMDIQALETALDAALDRKLAPLARMLAEQAQSGPSVAEVVGGLGYIVGLVGLVAYFKSREAR